MNALSQTVLHHPLVELIGWMLLHFLWQGVAVAIPLALLLALLRPATAATRYRVACGGLLVLAALPIATLIMLVSHSNPQRWRFESSRALADALESDHAATAIDPAALRKPTQVAGGASTRQPGAEFPLVPAADMATSASAMASPTSVDARRWMPAVAAVWFVGVTLLSLRLLGGLWRINRMRRRSQRVEDARLVEWCSRLAGRMNLRGPIELLQTAEFRVPTVIGLWRPALIVPLSLVTALTPAEVESILAHEMAHIRRRDWIVNLFQSLIETLWFYHPVVWWVSGVIRRERENCCDDVAVAVCGDRLALAKALVQLEALRGRSARLAMSATGGSLAQRIRRILLPRERCPATRWPAGIGSLVVASLMAGGLWVSVWAGSPDEGRDDPSVISASGDLDRPRPQDQEEGRLVVEQSGYPPTPTQQPTGVGHVLATHAYEMSRRESTGWIEHGGVSVPVDIGVTHEGVTVYLTLMFDVVAVETETGKALWKWDWNKSKPLWSTISILRVERPSGPVLVVELLPQPQRESDVRWQPMYLNLQSGEEVDLQHRRGQDPRAAAAVSLSIIEKDDHRIVRAALEGRGTNRLTEAHVQSFLNDAWRSPVGSWVTEEETLVSSARPHYVLAGEETVGMDSAEIVFNLPEGSGMRAEFSAAEIQVADQGDSTTLTIEDGRVKLIDAGGVVRAEASADNGAEFLVVEIRRADEEFSLTLRAQRRHPDDFPPVVQVRLNLATGAPRDEEQPPHGAVRYRLDHDAAQPGSPMKIKMRWHWELRRLEADRAAVPGADLAGDPSAAAVPPIVPQRARMRQEAWRPDRSDDTPWGRMAEHSGLQSRLTVQTAAPRVGEPLLVKLELRNSGAQPASFDAQDYAPFRVLRVEVPRPDTPPPFIGMSPQTSGGKETLQPGEVRLLWENVNVAELYLLAEARDYEIFAEGGEWAAQTTWRDSNRVKVTLQNGKLSPTHRLIRAIRDLDELPPDWNVSTGYGALFVSHSPTTLKRDVTTIQLWFTDEALPADFQLGDGANRQDVTTIGRCEAGFLHIAAPPRMRELWPEYVGEIRDAASRVLSFDRLPGAGDGSDGSAAITQAIGWIEGELPWLATGRVTDVDGRPLADVAVRAHCGIGTLHLTGSAVTGADGRYVLRFGPGLWSDDRQLVQAATISVSQIGHVEQNLHRQGDCVAAWQQPEGDLDWGGKTLDDLILPGVSKEINFVMVPAATLRGKVTDAAGDPLEGVRISLVGEELPPSSSVATTTRTDQGGIFELAEIPPGFAWQLLVEPAKAESPWRAWASPPIEFNLGEAGRTQIVYHSDSKRTDLSFSELSVVLQGTGENWRKALAIAREEDLVLKWDEPIGDTTKARSTVVLEMGTSEE